MERIKKERDDRFDKLMENVSKAKALIPPDPGA